MTIRVSSRIVVHDYSGHPGQAQLSRALATMGYEVTHQHCPSYATGRGSLERAEGDPVTLKFEGCAISSEFNRYSALTRVRHEIEYGRKASKAILRNQPDVVILSNVPLIAHKMIARKMNRRRVPMVFWHQDIYSTAIAATARRRLPFFGGFIGWTAERVERSIARHSAAVVAISPTFLDKLKQWGVAHKSTVVPNWAPIDELPQRPRRNAWSERMGLADRPVVLYSGTLGLKHDPSILAMVAARLEDTHPDAKVVVISEGKGREWLEEWKRAQGAHNLELLDFQPYEDLPDVLASADVLMAVLEPDASKYSVPSKVLTYLCAGRSVLGVIPADNSVAEILISNQAGWVVDPTNRDIVADKVSALLEDADLRHQHGLAGRRYAETEFSAVRAAERFVSVFGSFAGQPAPAAVPKQTLESPVPDLVIEPVGWAVSSAQAAS